MMIVSQCRHYYLFLHCLWLPAMAGNAIGNANDYITMSDNTLTLDHLSIGYHSHRHGCHMVAADICAQASPGSLTCLIGSNGTGKSTLLRTIAGLQQPLAGHIMVGTAHTMTLTAPQMAQMVSIVLTARPTAQSITVEQTVALGRAPYTGFWGNLTDADRHMVDDAIAAVGIDALRQRRVASLSDGECQKVMVAKALAQATPVILLDEPTAFLDFGATADLMLMLRQLAHHEGKTIVLSTHDIATALQTADCLWMLSSKGIIAGSPRQLAADGHITEYIGNNHAELDTDTLCIRMRV